MEEIMKKIKSGLTEIKKEQEELLKLEENSKKLQDEAKKIEEEKSQIKDTESGFYTDISKQYEEKYAEFRQADIKRMNKDKQINDMISIKKDEIVLEIKEKMKYIDENRNVNLEGIDIKGLKAEKEKIEREIKLNDTTKEEFEKMSDSDKQAVRKAKENYLNNKHRLDEINPTIKLADTLDGKKPKDKFMEMETLLKEIDDKFNRDNIGKLIEIIDKQPQSQAQPQINSQSQPAQQPQPKPQPNLQPAQPKQQSQSQIQSGLKQQKYNMILDISGNEININENDKLFYKVELKNKEEIKEKYALGSYFIGHKKSEKLVDYALISALEKIDDEENSIVNAYLTIIRDGKSQSENVKECLEKINNAVDIIYKFDKKDGKLLNGKEKRIARYAKKMGIASLEGISEKSIFEKIMDKLGRNKGRRLLESKEKPKTLGSGSNSRAQEYKNKTMDLINKDREQQGIRSAIKVDNKDNKIEKAAQEQIGKEVQDIMEHEQEEQK